MQPISSSTVELEPAKKKQKARDTYYDDDDEDGGQSIGKKIQRDDLTLMVRQLHPKAEDFALFELFSRAGKVIDVRMIMDERSGRCVGVGYVEMADAAGMQAALALTGTPICGTPIVVGSSLAEKNRLASQGASLGEIKAIGGHAGGAIHDTAVNGLKVYVGGLHYSITEAQLEELFAAFGAVESCDLKTEGDGTSKGYGFVHFKDANEGYKCIDQMNGFVLIGRPISVSVSKGEDGSGSARVTAGGPPAGMGLMPLHMGGSMPPGGIGTLVGGGAAGGDGNDQVSKLDSLGQGVGDDTGSSLGTVTASTRSAIMAKLAESVSGGMEVPDDMRRAAQASGLVALPSSATSAEGSRCLVLKNMFDRLSDEAQSNPNFFAELADEVRGECARHGTVLHLQCDKWSNGFIYLKLLSHPEAARLRDTMHGRYFAKNKILAELVPEATYNKKWKLQ